MTTNETRPADQAGRYFQARRIDDVPQLLDKSYRLRYQVYCLERKFLPAENYPDGLERDEFDCHSIHVGAVDASGELAGTARAVKISELGLPLFRHCTTFSNGEPCDPVAVRLVEVGRLSVSRSYRRRADDDAYGVTNPSLSDTSAATRRNARMRRPRDGVFPILLKALYQATKRMGATHWLAGMEPSLEHLLSQHGFPFRLIGPESDYFGLVAPYRMDLKEFDSVILSGRFPALDAFVMGLEPEWSPQADAAGAQVEVIAPGPEALGDRVVPSTSINRPNHAPIFGPQTEALLLTEFRRAAADVPAYRTLLEEHDVAFDRVRDLASFARLCPLLSKTNTFNRFSLDQLSLGGDLRDVADVLTSSGHGGSFSFGVISRKQAALSPEFIDRAFDDAFKIASRKTLAINCLPMGVIFSSHRMTVATTSVREDMAAALVETFGRHYDQIVLVGDPLFLKKLTDYAAARALDWSRYTVNVLIGEEVFGEHYRGYLEACLGLNLDRSGRGYIMSSFGVGELGLHLGYETTATIGLRRALFDHPLFARDLLGIDPDQGYPLPMIFSFNPLRTFIEVVDPDHDGFGRMTTSMLDPERSVPLLRYQTGDSVRLLDEAQVIDVAGRHGVILAPDLPRALLALKGRERETLPNGSHVAFYKDALYADHRIARDLTGAFRLTFSGVRCTMHVQLCPSPTASPAFLEEGILRVLPINVRPEALVLWEYARFPFGMSLNYERKFAHYASASQARETDSAGSPVGEQAL